MTSLGQIVTIARWEVKRSLGTMGKGVLPIAVLLLILLLAVTGFTAKSGLHLQDGIYRIGIDDPRFGGVLAGDSRFVVYQQDGPLLFQNRDSFDIIVISDEVFVHDTDRGRAALQTLRRDYDRYVNVVYSSQEDLFAAYPLWIDTRTVKSELDFSATQSGRQVVAPVRRGEQPIPEGPVLEVPTPAAGISLSREELRTGLIESQQVDSQVSRYTEYFSGESPFGDFKTPSQLSPPLPFDSIILIFVFIFPLYFTSQFYMMGIMNERIERRGEPLLSAPVRPWVIVAGKALPYFLGMLGISLVICLWIQASPLMLLPLFSIILFFLANALIIGMVSRSFKELSFISIFFSTLATSYLFFPSIFANVHVISLVSPLTLMILTLQGEPYTASQYFFSTSLFFLTSAVLFYIGIANFREETLFSQGRLLSRIREFISTSLSTVHPYLSLFAIGVLVVPFVFMAQMMVLVLFFNLPMPLSLVLLLVAAAAIEEIAKSIGIYALYVKDPAFFSWKRIVLASIVIAAAFLFGEKLLLLVTLTQISESVFGSVLFTSLGVLYLPFLLHFIGVLIVSAGLKIRGMTGYIAGLLLATVVHCGYNLYFIMRWLG